jgi:hypothetical protein
VTRGRNDVPELTVVQKARWQAAVSDMSEMSVDLRNGSATQQDIQGVLNRLQSCDINTDRVINAPHVPPDAGPYAPALQRILYRIPDGWGRWICHDAGWYEIVVACDQRLAVIDPDYVVHQVKEKFGTLRYECVPSGEWRPELWGTFDVIVSEAEHASTITCERCGEPGVLHKGKLLLKTLCAACAETLGYAPTDRDDHSLPWFGRQP